MFVVGCRCNHQIDNGLGNKALDVYNRQLRTVDHLVTRPVWGLAGGQLQTQA